VKHTKNQALIAIKAMLSIVGIAFIVELLVRAGMEFFPHTENRFLLAFENALLLALFMAPPIYWLALRPLKREHEKRREVEQLAADLSQLAVTDSLTHIMNRRGITNHLLDLMAHAERYGHPLSVAMADIDHFKRVNDTYGHEVGDSALALTASVLSETLRMPDKVGRYGGEEFLVILPHTSLAQAQKICERMREAVERWSFDNGRNEELKLTISFGVTQFRKSEDLEQLLSRADKALYEAKAAGRNRVVTKKASARSASAA
jgi:diguanylate cyclase (GGDEF)-like protein